jgi:hypothetical protein
MWVYPAVVLNREYGGSIALDIFKHRERVYAVEGEKVAVDKEPVFNNSETVSGRVAPGMEHYARGSNYYNKREEVIAEEERGHNERGCDDTYRPVPVGAFGVVLVFGPVPLKNRGRHTPIIHCSAEPPHSRVHKTAEGVGLEPTRAFGPLVFKTSSLPFGAPFRYLSLLVIQLFSK